VVVLTEANHGKTVEISLGEQITIRLDENPTTGYRWAIARNNPEILAPAGDEYNPAGSAGIGGGGQRAFTFEAKKEGIDPLEFKLWREWEGERSVTRRFTLTVRVG
jgi:inhibitor of cysteine peptidase